jgi:hypothetical protein
MAFFMSGSKFMRQGIHYVKFIKKIKINLPQRKRTNLIVGPIKVELIKRLINYFIN